MRVKASGRSTIGILAVVLFAAFAVMSFGSEGKNETGVPTGTQFEEVSASLGGGALLDGDRGMVSGADAVLMSGLMRPDIGTTKTSPDNRAWLSTGSIIAMAALGTAVVYANWSRRRPFFNPLGYHMRSRGLRKTFSGFKAAMIVTTRRIFGDLVHSQLARVGSLVALVVSSTMTANFKLSSGFWRMLSMRQTRPSAALG